MQFWWVQVFFCAFLLSSDFFWWGRFGFITSLPLIASNRKGQFFRYHRSGYPPCNCQVSWSAPQKTFCCATFKLGCVTWLCYLGRMKFDEVLVLSNGVGFSEEAWSKRYKGVTGVFFFLLSLSGDLLFLPVFARKKHFCTWWQIKRNLKQDNQTQSRQATWRWFAFLISPYFTVKNKVSLGLRPLPVQPVPGHFDCSTRQLDGWTAINSLGNKCASEYTFHLFLQYLLDKRWLCKQMDRPDVKRKYTNVGKSVDVLAWRSDTWPTKQQRWCCRTWCFTMWFTEFSTKGWRNKSREKNQPKKAHTIFTPFKCKKPQLFFTFKKNMVITVILPGAFFWKALRCAQPKSFWRDGTRPFGKFVGPFWSISVFSVKDRDAMGKPDGPNAPGNHWYMFQTYYVELRRVTKGSFSSAFVALMTGWSLVVK